MKNPWDILSKTFDVHKTSETIDPRAADNILIAWPPIIEAIMTHFKGKDINSLTALDYGCGTGGFTQELHAYGFTVTGADSSDGMLTIAKQSLPDLSFVRVDEIPANASYDLIAGLMVFQFIEPIEKTMRELTARLNKGGFFIFAVFNPAFVKACLSSNTLFSDFDSIDNPTVGSITLAKDLHIPTYIRTAKDYDALCKKFGLHKVTESYPAFTNEFLAKYSVSIPVHEPEYLILGYRR